MKFINEVSYFDVIVIDDVTGKPVTGLSITYVIVDLSDNSTLTSGTLTEVSGHYKCSYTFTVADKKYRLSCTTPAGYEDYEEVFEVVDKDSFKTSVSGLALETSVQGVLTLLNSNSYGLSALKDLIDLIDTSTELQAKFTEIKGVGWSSETMKAIKDAIDNITVTGGVADWTSDQKLIILNGIKVAKSIYRIFNPVYSKIKGQDCMTSATKKYYDNTADCNSDVNGLVYSVTATYDGNARMATYKEVPV